MRAVCFLYFGVAWIALGNEFQSSIADEISGTEIYTTENWVSCLDRGELTCEVKSGQHASYNPTTGSCESGPGTDCYGSENYFESLEKCNEFCKNAPKPPCSLEMDDGPGRALHPRWYFDTETANCTAFYYGGMLGNNNNFLTKEECQAKCSGFSLLRKLN
ncbi:BPTI/Kunitz domain-containing protein-like [Ixodes scapularis]|uniref:BPTI/Kunitz domain-containing protein-like n=1 Tax=Ixodes scapularis TaxID=6945 RepID=UPI001A9EDEB8|nr:BPTI/Kunitz domain-containing protein-like [Ixodes scapularis]